MRLRSVHLGTSVLFWFPFLPFVTSSAFGKGNNGGGGMKKF